MWVLTPNKQTEKTRKLINLGKLNEGKKWDEYSEEYKSLLKSKGCASVFILMWMLLGLFTFNWVAFLAFLILEMVVFFPLSKSLRETGYFALIHWINSVVGLVFGLFVLINEIHLRIDLYELVITLIN
tara:strand:+ start:1768 stop:2151 length:384 start_codon:yes stop_codon:yes gene_type:complete